MAPTLRVPIRALPLVAGPPLVVVEGAIVQRVLVRNRATSMLLGPGDLLSPGGFAAPWSAVARALTPTVLASLSYVPDHYRARVNLVLLDLAQHQTGRLAAQAVIGQLLRIEDRLAAVLPSLAERWGVVTPDGIVLPRFFRHWVFAELVGVRRPSLTTAAQRMEQDGQMCRLRDGRWLLGDHLV